MFGGKPGLVMVGLLGGLISTTATTLVYARHSKKMSHFATSAATIILLSHLMLFVRIAVVVAVVEMSALMFMLPWILGGLVAGLVCLGVLMQRHQMSMQFPELQVSNPTELKIALGFALGFSAVLFLSVWMNDVFHTTGAYVVAFFSGLSDVDAITIANLKLYALGTINIQVAIIAVVIAFLANLIVKLGIVLLFGDRQLRAPVLIGFGLLVVGVLLGLMFALSRV